MSATNAGKRADLASPTLQVPYICGNMPGLVVGSRVACEADVANDARIGTVTKVYEDRGHFFDLACDDGHVMRGMGHGVFGGLAPRFSLSHDSSPVLVQVDDEDPVPLDAFLRVNELTDEEVARAVDLAVGESELFGIDRLTRVK